MCFTCSISPGRPDVWGVMAPQTLHLSSAGRSRVWRLGAAMALSGAALAAVVAGGSSAGAQTTFLGSLPHQSMVASTIPTSRHGRPGDGDVNPYGVAVIDRSVGRLHRGDVLVSNFNNSSNQQGTGRTIVEVSPSGHQFAFARLPELPGGTGLTTALSILPGGWVVVGNLPTNAGALDASSQGSLLVVNAFGHLVKTITAPDINGPWDMTAVSFGHFSDLFVTNVLNGTVAGGGAVVNQGTVVRLGLWLGGRRPVVVSNTVIGSGFAEATNTAALVLGPTGVGLGRHGTLYVADTVNSAIQAIPNAVFRGTSAGTGRMVSPAPGATNLLNAPLGLAIAPNGDILTVNGGDGNIVETTPSGMQVDSRVLNDTAPVPTGGAGALFGLAVGPHGKSLYFVDDDFNTLNALTR
jgi:hypothetical protein